MKIRTANKKDGKQITELYYQFHSGRKKINKPLPIGNFKSMVITVVAEDKAGELLGFCMGNFTDYGPTRYGYIEELFVKEGHRNRGVGRELVKCMQKEFKKLKISIVCVTTEKGNKSIELYKKLGFIIDKKNCWLYWNPSKQKRVTDSY